jgi:D-alanyl-D-alanine-carboxypeptidase/D-alanyl-D-alanine-endopeptidase
MSKNKTVMNKLTLAISLSLGVILVSCTNRYHVAKDIPAPVKTTIENAVKNKHRVGISLALINKQGVHYYSYGDQRLSDAMPMNKNSMLGVGSLSKLFTSLVLAEKVSKMELNLEDPVNNFLPAMYQIPSSATNTMRLKHLVTHTSGLPKSIAFHDSPDALFKAVSEYDYASNYGEKYIYSNIGMALLGHILEIQSGQKLDQLVMKRITHPLEMHHTTYQLESIKKNDLAQGHLELKPISEVSKENSNLGFIFGGLYSNTEDLAKLIEAYLSESTSELSATLALTQQKYSDGITGIGWKIKDFKGTDIFYHGGEQAGYQSFVGFNKHKGIGVVLMANSQNQDNLQNIAIHLLSNGKIPLPNFSLPKEVEIAPEYLNRYVGFYKSVDSPKENTFEISIVNSKLYCTERTSAGKLIRESYYYAKNESEFFYKDIPAVAHFQYDSTSRKMKLSIKITDPAYASEDALVFIRE